MSDEQKENRINVDDLPQAEKELTPEEQQKVQGGGITGTDFQFQADANTSSAGDKDRSTDIIVGAGPGAPGGHVK